MASTTYELVWLKQLLKELQFSVVTQTNHIVIIRLLLILDLISSFMKWLNTLKLIVILLKTIWYLETSRLSLLT